MKKLLLFLAFSGFIQGSYACSCYSFYKIPLFEGFNSLTEIFEGTVIKREVNSKTKLTYYHFKVERAYKGVVEDEITVITTPNSAAACGQYFDPNSPWLIYAKDGFTSRCASNTKLNTPKNKNRINILQNLNILRNTQEKIIIETNKKGDTVAIGKLNINKQPIGNWTYIFEKNECTVTRNVCYDYYGCILEDHSVKSCN